MTSGLMPDDKPGQPNYLNVVLTQPVKVPPETEWSYASLPVDLLSIVIQSATGKTVRRNFLNPEIAGKIGIPALPWQTLGLYTKGSSGAFIRPRDLARVGYLMMMDGAWSGRQIIAKRHISNIRQHPSSLDDIPFVPTPGSPSTAGSGSPKF
jgi:CubicO group peptidase (beta-lactamase class C family)